MNRLFTVKERILMIANIRGPDGSAQSFLSGVMVVVNVDNKLLRGVDIGGALVEEASRNALHKALQGLYPGLKRVEITQGESNDVWHAIVDGYQQQISLKEGSENCKINRGSHRG